MSTRPIGTAASSIGRSHEPPPDHCRGRCDRAGGRRDRGSGDARHGVDDSYADAVAATRSALAARPDAREWVRFATLAANGHNTQPWRFRIDTDGIAILPDFTRRTPIVDPDDHHLFASLGCAAENLALAATANGPSGEILFVKTNGGSVAFAFGKGRGTRSSLVDAVARRQSTRAEYDGRPLDNSALNLLVSAAAVSGVDLTLITDRAQIDGVRDLLMAGNSAQMADPAFMRELKAWLRFNPRAALMHGDGLFSATTGNPLLPTWLGPHVLDWGFNAASENEKYARHLKSSSGIAIFTGAQDNAAHWVASGRACQRFALQATSLGFKTAFINQPVEVARLRPELAGLIGMPGRRPDIVMRFGRGPTLAYSARRPVSEVLVA